MATNRCQLISRRYFSSYPILRSYTTYRNPVLRCWTINSSLNLHLRSFSTTIPNQTSLNSSLPTRTSSVISNLNYFFPHSSSSSSGSSITNKSLLTQYLLTNVSSMSAAEIAFLLTKTSKINYLLSQPVIQLIAERLYDPIVALQMTKSELSQILFSLKDYKNDLPEILQLRGAIVNLFKTKFHSSSSAFDSRSLGMCFYSLKNMTYDMEHVPELMEYLLFYLKNCHERFSIHTLCHSLRCLPCLPTNHFMTKELLAIFYSKLVTCPPTEIVESKDVMNCYRSFQSLSIESDEVNTFFCEFIPHIDRFNRYLHSSGSFYHDPGRQPFAPLDLIHMYRSISRFNMHCPQTIQLYSYLHDWLISPLKPLTIPDTAKILFAIKDRQKSVAPINATFQYLLEKILSLSQWNPTTQSAKIPLKYEEITSTLQSIGHVSTPSQEFKDTLRSMKQYIAYSLQINSQFLTSNDIFRLFFGVSHLSSALKEDRELFLLLGKKLHHPDLDLSPKTITSIVNSLRYMDSNCHEVEKFLEFLTMKLQNLKDLQIADKWGCIYGLQSLSSNSNVVRSFLKVLNSKFVPYPQSYRHTPQSVGLTFFGLQSLSPSHEEVRKLYQIVYNDYHSLTIPLDSQAISNIFFSLQNLHDDSIPEVKQLLQLILQLVKQNRANITLSAPGISQLVLGIKRFHSTNPVAVDLLEVITHSFKQSTVVINCRIIVNCITSLRHFSIDLPQTDAFFSLLNQKIQIMKKSNPKEKLTYTQIIQLLSCLRDMKTLTPSLHNLLLFLNENVSRLSKEQIRSIDFAACLLGLHQLSFHESQLVPSLIRNLLQHATLEIQPFPVQSYVDYLSSLQHLPTEHLLTIDLMNYLILRLPPSTQRVSSTMIVGIIHGLKNKNPHLSETKLLMNHAIQLIENTNKRELIIQEMLSKPSSSSSSSSTSSPSLPAYYSDDHVLKISVGLSQFKEISVEYLQFVEKIPKTLQIIQPVVTQQTRSNIQLSFNTREDLLKSLEIQNFLRVISTLGEGKE